MPARPALTELKSSTSEVGSSFAHLVVRELSRAHRDTILGWIWPLVLLLVRLERSSSSSGTSST
jgi:ABC-type polysaccharide/polyol phosphate export permease